MGVEDRSCTHINFKRRSRTPTAAPNRHSAGNSVHDDLHQLLSRPFCASQEDARSDVPVPSGEGRHFCVGGYVGWIVGSTQFYSEIPS